MSPAILNLSALSSFHMSFTNANSTPEMTPSVSYTNKWLMTKSGRLCQIYVSKEDTAAHLRFGITLALALLAHLASNVSMCVSSHKSMCV